MINILDERVLVEVLFLIVMVDLYEVKLLKVNIVLLRGIFLINL